METTTPPFPGMSCIVFWWRSSPAGKVIWRSSFRNYLEVAKERAEPKAAKRAVQMALSAGDTEGGLEAVRLWIELAPEDWEADEVHAVLLIRAGELEEAVEVLRGVIDARDHGAPGEGLRRVSDILVRESAGAHSPVRIDRVSALRVMEMLVAGRPDDPDALFVFGHLLARLGEFERAERAFERVLSVQPGPRARRACCWPQSTSSDVTCHDRSRCWNARSATIRGRALFA